jgi:hypothetical protein
VTLSTQARPYLAPSGEAHNAAFASTRCPGLQTLRLRSPVVLTGGQPTSGENSRPPAFVAFLPVNIAPAASPALSPHQRQGRMCKPHLASNGYTSVKYVV